jgi:hypothetical protein
MMAGAGMLQISNQNSMNDSKIPAENTNASNSNPSIAT